MVNRIELVVRLSVCIFEQGGLGAIAKPFIVTEAKARSQFLFQYKAGEFNEVGD